MKKLVGYIITAIALSALSPTPSRAATEITPFMIPTTSKVPAPTRRYEGDTEKVDARMIRLKELAAMKKSKLSRSERRELRKELRALKKLNHSGGGGVYLSVGALLLIILLILII